MCVIAVVHDDNKRPSEDEVLLMWRQNSHGGGVAWREDGEIQFQKGLDKEAMLRFAAELPAPFVLHFRISSNTDRSNPLKALTHPFLVDAKAPLDLSGSTDGDVLFHNGHWSDWIIKSNQWLGLAAGQIQIPVGPWSDTRAMAFWAAHYGYGIFEGQPWGIDEKIIVLQSQTSEENPHGLLIFGNGWQMHKGYTVSNDYWIPRMTPVTPGHRTLDRTTPVAKAPTAAASGGAAAPVHPFLQAKEELETALLAHSLKDEQNRPLGSWTQVKKKRKEYWKQYKKYPDMARQIVDEEFEKLLDKQR